MCSNPVFNERFDFMLQSKPSKVQFQLFDSDLTTSDDPLGCCVLPLDESHYDEKGHAVEWLAVTNTPGMTTSGTKASGMLQVQVNCTKVNVTQGDSVAQARMKQVLSLGVHSLLLTSVQFQPANAHAAMQCARGGELHLVFILQFGQTTVRSPTVPVDASLVQSGVPIPVHKQARFWVLAGQERYVARVYVYADTNRASEKPADLQLLAVANVATERLMDAATASREEKLKTA